MLPLMKHIDIYIYIHTISIATFHWFYDDTPLKFNIAPEKEDVWETTFLFWFQDYFSGAMLP